MERAELLALLDRVKVEGWTELESCKSALEEVEEAILSVPEQIEFTREMLRLWGVPPKVEITLEECFERLLQEERKYFVQTLPLLEVLKKAAVESWTKLDLAGLDLVEFPPEIGELTQLQVLTLGKWDKEARETKGNRLTTLPPEIGQLQNLTTLNLDSNQLSEFPAAIAQLQNLATLSLGSNQLSELPEEIAQLQNLNTLELWNNQLSELPEEIAQLRNLTTLNLDSNQLRKLPEEIAQLRNLTTLNLDSNQLRKLPEEIAQLRNLTMLNLDGNPLRELPVAITQLQNLTSLSLSRNQLSELPAAIAQLQNLTALNLSFNELSELPAEIAQLQNLTTLDLSFNELSELPAEIAQLQNLTSLSLSRNQLSELPAVIVQLQNLTTLDLSRNQLSELPAVIVQLQNLTTLDLSRNQLSELPAAIAKLQNLTTLDLWNNQLIELPAVIAKLQNLTTLYLFNNQLSELPAAIAQLQNLTSLSLSNNQLSELPAAIAQLQNLTSLSLSNNQLSELPAAIAQLQNLTSLSLFNNQLSELPAAIAQLQNLTSLHLSSNQLIELPAAIAQLQNLARLDLRNNQLSDLPDFIQDLHNLEELDLRGNPIAIPPEILGGKGWSEVGDLQTILDFHFKRQRDPKPLYEAKLLIIGEGEAGKTSLAKKLKDETYALEAKEKSTDGIDVLPWEIDHLDGTPMRVNIWDFGGQEIYHATHQFFLTKRSLYLLVVEDRKEHTDFYYWLKVAETFGENSPLLIIKNEKRGDPFNFDERALRGEFSNLKDTFSTNLVTNRGLDTIRSAIQNYFSGLDHVKQTIPAPWADIRAVLENLSQKDPFRVNSGRNYLELRDYFDLCRRNGFSTEKEMLAASQFLHDLGICLHFQNVHFLKKILILRPEWATGTLYKILTNEAVKANFGRFNDDTLEQLWDRGDAAKMRDELLQLMKEFALCYEIPGCKGRYIAPQLLKSESLDYDWDSTDNLILSHRYQFKPKAIFPQLIVALHEQIEENCRVWKHGLVITNGPARAEIIEDDRYYEANITIRVSGSNKRQLLTIVGHELDKINHSYERLTYEILIPCNCVKCKGSQDPETYSYKILQEFIRDHEELIQCRKSKKMVNVRRLIDDIADPPTRPDLDEMRGFDRVNQGPAASPYSSQHLHFHLSQQQTQNPSMNNITQTHSGSGDNVAGDKTVNHFPTPQSPEAAQQVIQELLKQLKISEQTTTAKLQNQVMIQDLTWQQTLWAALKNAGPEFAKNAVSLALASAGLPGAMAAAAFNVVVEGVRGGLEARDALPPDDDNPFGELGF